MNASDKKALVETFKAGARFVWFGLLGLFTTVFVALAANGAVTNTTVTIAGLQVNLGIVLTAVFTFAAKGLDTYIHKNDNIKVNGIAPQFLQR